MKTHGNISAVIESLRRDHGLLAAYLEATDKIDWRALHEPMMIGETPKSKTGQESPFAFGRANLIRVP